MKTPVIAVALAIGLSGFALAGEDQSAFTIDLRGAREDASVYYLKCQYGNDLANGCGLISVWREINDISGLQTVGGMDGSPIDKRVLA